MTGTSLPRSLAPLPDESLPGFLLRLAHRLDLSPARLAQATGLPTSGTTARIPASLLLALDTHTAVRFAAATRLKPAEARTLTLATVRASYPPVDPAFGFHRRRHGATGRTVNGVFVQERWILARFSRYCPQCLAGDTSTIQRRHGGAWNKLWRLPVVFACPHPPAAPQTHMPSVRPARDVTRPELRASRPPEQQHTARHRLPQPSRRRRPPRLRLPPRHRRNQPGQRPGN
jgi:hypothetical protein